MKLYEESKLGKVPSDVKVAVATKEKALAMEEGLVKNQKKVKVVKEEAKVAEEEKTTTKGVVAV